MASVMQQMLLASAPAPATVTFIGNQADAGSFVSTHTFPALAIGGENPSRRVMILVHVRGSAAADTVISSATIGGIPATVGIAAVSGSDGAVQYNAACLISALIPTGTTTSVVINFPNNVRVYLGVFRGINVSQSLSVDNDSASVLAQTATVTVDVPGNGFLISGLSAYSLLGMTLASGATQSYATNWDASTNRWAVGGLLNVTGAQLNHGVTYNRQTSDGLSMAAGVIADTAR